MSAKRGLPMERNAVLLRPHWSLIVRETCSCCRRRDDCDFWCGAVSTCLVGENIRPCPKSGKKAMICHGLNYAHPKQYIALDWQVFAQLMSQSIEVARQHQWLGEQ
eukprot:4333782-Amphidinium_carterae.1